MFGYIRPFIPNLKVCEYDLYKAVYCGVCHELGESYGVAARFTLSYDFTFLTMLSAGLHGDEEYTVDKSLCPFNPFKKKPALNHCKATEFSAGAAMLLLWGKNRDNIDDSGLVKRLCYEAVLPFTQRKAKKAGLKEPKIFESVDALPTLQKKAEESPDFTLDSVSEPTSHVLSEIFREVGKDEGERRILERLGYMLGRFCYICDAVDDLEQDKESGAFNPLINDPSMERITALLNSSIAEACAAYALLTPHEFSEILDNIMYEGLKSTAADLINRRNKHE
ncbi:MAG: DUF5685 family protein [Oscillospiraceae bacterium]